MEKRLALFFVGIFLCLGSALAQTKISGTVYSQEDGQPIIGAAVKVVGTSTGMLTDVNGRFSVVVPEGKKQLEITYLGFEGKTVTAKNGMRIFLKADAKMVDEVVVVAYGTAKKSSFTGSAQSINADDIDLRPVATATKALEGHVTGVQMTNSSGQPGSAPNIRIRGFGSINASSAPLYVVDGIPYDGDLSSINPSDIESMTVLKDASAGALYGARGANGVVMITTKQGKEGRVNVTWRSNVGWSNRATKRYDNVNQKEFVQLVYEGLRNDEWASGTSWAEAEAIARQSLGAELGGEYYNPFKNYTWDNIIDPTTGQVRADAQSAWNEDWLDAVTRKNAFRHEHQFSIDGGNEKTKYALSLGYLNEDGTLKTTAFQRYSARVNVDTKINDWFKANVGINVAHSISNFSDYDGSSYSNVWYTAQFINPLFPVYLKDAQGQTIYKEGNIEYDWGEIRDNGNQRPGSLNDFNSMGMLMLDQAETRRDVAGLRSGLVFGSDKDSFGWAKGIKLALNFGFDYDNANYMSFMNMEHGNMASSGGYLEKQNGRTQSYTFNQLLTWNREFGKHSIDVLAGHEFYAYKYNYLMGARSGLMSGLLELRPGATLKGADSYSQDYRINSWLSRINYSFDDKYYLSASFRSDASSRFKRGNRTGSFWSVGGNWRISKENFMKNATWIDNLSFKVSYGQQGNDDILSGSSSNYYVWQGLSDVSYPNANTVGAILSTLKNEEVSWEKNGNFNIGLEGALFDRRLRFSAEYYSRKTSDMLLSYPMAVSTGFSGYSANVGSMTNKGFEFELSGTPLRFKDFEWNLTWMGSTIKNEVTKLTAESPEILSGNYIIKEGLPLNTFYLRKSAGVDPATGEQLYWIYDKDENGNITNERISASYSEAGACRYEMGSRIPNLYGSISTDLSWKGFNLSVLTTYSIGGKILDGSYYSTMNVTYLSGTWNRNVLRRWQKPGDVTDVPRMAVGKTDIYITDRYLIDASYFAIKNITLSYTFPKALITRAGLAGLKVYGSYDNVALFSHLDGMDPQYNFSGGTSYVYSPNKTLTIGLEVNF